MRAEWTKLRTTSGAAWLLAVTAIVSVGLSVAVKTPLIGVYAGQAPVAVLGVLVVSGEYSNGLIGTTLTAVPSRAAVLAAKATVVGTAVAGAASMLALAALVAGAAPHATARAVAYLTLISVLGVGTAAVVHDSAVAIGCVLGLLYVPPVVAPLVPHVVEKLAPMTASLPVLTAWAAGALLLGTRLLR